MHHAPAVTYPIGRARSLRWGLVAFWLLGALPVVCMLFMPLAQEGPAQEAMISVVIVAVIWGLSGLGLARFWRRQDPGALRWDGADWWLDGPDQGASAVTPSPGRAAVRLDLQRCLLLHWRANGRGPVRWVWADADADPARWHLLRCALYSKAPSQVTQAETTI